MCHLILLIQGLGLAAFWIRPPSIALPVRSYWFVLKAMHQPMLTGAEAMRGATDRIIKAGYSRRVA
jgi:hypothetical protein